MHALRGVTGKFEANKPTNEGSKTATIYTLIREGNYREAIQVLEPELEGNSRSRACLSLLGYCYYYLQDYENAAAQYAKLVHIYPSVEEYRVYYAQMLAKAGQYEAADRASNLVDDPQYTQRMQYLQAAIHYEQGDTTGTKAILDQCIQGEPETMVGYACLVYKESKYDKAREMFLDATKLLGYQSDLAYNVALCLYRMKQYGASLKWIADIIERGVREHPELSVGSGAEGLQVLSVGNSQTLKETALIEAFNLKAAIEFSLDNLDAAVEALNDMPPRSDPELDPVSLHNVALMRIDMNPNDGFQKLNFLLQQPSFPLETFGNLLLLYIKYEYHHLAADVLAENTHLHEACLTPELYEYLEAAIATRSSPAEAFQKLEDLGSKHIEILRRLTKKIQDARIAHDNQGIKDALKLYDEALERYIPVLMAQANIYWEREDWAMVEKIFKQSAEFCADHDDWKLNVAHVFFMHGDVQKFKDAIRYYEPIVKKHTDNILGVTAMVLANLCVSYIMTSQNEEAEELMRQIEKEEERVIFASQQNGGPEKHLYHLCIVNLVIGTLYCSKGNYTFGITRVIKSLEPYERKFGPDTWYHAKRCFLAHVETLSKHLMVLKDDKYEDIMVFLDAAEEHGKDISTIVGDRAEELSEEEASKKTVAHQARLLKRMYMKISGR